MAMTKKQRNSRKGGLKAAKKLGKRGIVERASKGGQALVTRFSSDYFRELAKKRHANKNKEKSK